MSPPAGQPAHRDCEIMSSVRSGGVVAPSACLAVPLHAHMSVRSELHVRDATLIVSDLGLAVPMCMVQRPQDTAWGHGVGRRTQWAPRVAVFAAAACTHETSPTPHGFTCVLSSGWEVPIGRQRDQLALWGLE